MKRGNAAPHRTPRRSPADDACARLPCSAILVHLVALNPQQQRRLLRLARFGTSEEREQAYRTLVADLRAPAVHVIRRTLHAGGIGTEHVEEVWQQALYRFFTVGVHRYRGESSVRTYFVRTALYAAIDLVRHHGRMRSLDHEPISSPCPVADSASHAEQLAALEALRHCIGTLRGLYAEAVELYYLREAGSCGACAERLGISTQAFMKRLERARTKLQACVERQLRDEPGKKR
jgi:RNA polymerase sigma factor (sigma-70 family)